jgi:hypothetical protein
MLASCISSDVPSSPCNEFIQIECSNQLTILVDDQFSNQERTIIMGSIQEWSMRSNINFDLIFKYLPANQLFANSNHPYTFSIFLLDPGDPLLGWTDWNIDVVGAYIKIKPNLPDSLISPVIGHEFGHAMGLSHYLGNHAAIMHPNVFANEPISCQDLLDLCQIWLCSVDCDPNHSHPRIFLPNQPNEVDPIDMSNL